MPRAMPLPLVFACFLLASTSRVEDSPEIFEELHCRMFGKRFYAGEADEETKAKWIKWIQDGCGCPPLPAPRYEPAFPDTARKVGWEQDLNKDTAITYSFEKEWEGGPPPRLHELYGPAGHFCEENWKDLEDHEKAHFMRIFESELKFDRPALNKYGWQPWKPKTEEDEKNECYLGYLPLKRSLPTDDENPKPTSISSFIEMDYGPWEIKADTYYFDLETMESEVNKLLPYLHMPQFPAERRIQVHAVASLRRFPDYDGELAPAANMALHSSLRLIQLFFSDYTFLRLGFTNGPAGDKCGQEGASFKCDVFTDTYNDVIDKPTADEATRVEEQPLMGTQRLYDGKEAHKMEIVGIRASEAYGGAESNLYSEGDSREPYRVGFEIRKSESFGAAIQIADAISDAISAMDPAGSTKVRITKEHDIDQVRAFAQGHRMTLLDGSGFCSAVVQNGARKDTGFVIGSEYGDSVIYDSGRLPFGPPALEWEPAVAALALYLHKTVAREVLAPDGSDLKKATAKLWKMLALLLCSDWAQLVGDVPSRDSLLDSFQQLKGYEITAKLEPLRTAYTLKAFKELFSGGFVDTISAFHKMIAQYAYDVSQRF